MAYRLKFSGRALREIGEAFDWYEKQSEGLGFEFELAFELQLKRLEQVPLLYTEIILGVRRTLLPRFRMAFSIQLKTIWFTFWPSFTMHRVRDGGQVNVPVNRSFRRTIHGSRI